MSKVFYSFYLWKSENAKRIENGIKDWCHTHNFRNCALLCANICWIDVETKTLMYLIENRVVLLIIIQCFLNVLYEYGIKCMLVLNLRCICENTMCNVLDVRRMYVFLKLLKILCAKFIKFPNALWGRRISYRFNLREIVQK